MKYIHRMNLSGLDLNLLVALDALLREGGVTRAADRLGLSQPAASHALRRLRELIGDPLLVRRGGGMTLTPKAESLRAPLGEVLEKARGLFVQDRFDPAESRRRFSLMMPDLVASLLAPILVERLESIAPGVRLDFVPWSGPTMMATESEREIDLVVTYQAHEFPGFHRERLYSDTDLLAVRRGRPGVRRLRELPVFLAAHHVAVVGRGESADPIDIWLAGEGVARVIAVAAPTYLQALHLAARSDLVAFVPSRLVRLVARQLGLIAVPPPLDPGLDEQFVHHPSRLHVDPASVWLRGLVRDAGRSLDAPIRKLPKIC
jgi:DNA-binding transcriptional LysR family regulator